MKIGIFTDTYEPKIDGVVNSIKSYKAELERNGHSVHIYSPRNSIWKSDGEFKNNTRVASFSYYAYPDLRFGIPYNPVLIERIRRERFDIIHTQTPGSLGMFGIFLARLFGIPAIHTYHTHLEQYMHYSPLPEFISKMGIKRFVRLYINRHHAAISPSTSIKKTLEEYGVTIPIHVLPTGVELDRFRNIKPLAWKNNAKFLITFGRVGKEKNLDFLVKAFERVAKKYQDLHFLIIGGGPYENELKSIVDRSPFHDRIHLLGMMRQAEIFPLVAKAEMFLTASTTETQGLTTVESLALGTPVVAVRGSGVEDTLAGDKGGYLVPENLEKFCEKIELLLSDPEVRAEKSKEALSRAKDYSTESATKKLHAIYDGVIKNS